MDETPVLVLSLTLNAVGLAALAALLYRLQTRKHDGGTTTEQRTD